jgi:hypothetical protein
MSDQKPHPSWTLETIVDSRGVESTYWNPPKPAPRVHGKSFYWDEELLDWVENN